MRALRPASYLDAAYVLASAPYRRSLAAARDRRIPWARARPGDRVEVDGVGIRVLAPDSAWMTSMADPNEASLVVMVEVGAVRFLLPGDAEREEERWLVERWGRELRADVLKVGHHGSGTSSGTAFLDAVRPRIAVVSVGAGNGYGHPSPRVLADLAGRGVAVYRTDVLGTIVLRTDGRDVWVTHDE